jgi:homoserine kinase type II
MILTKLSKEDFEKILSNYNIGNYKKHKHIPEALENTVYLLKTTKGKFILKIYEDLKDILRLKKQIKIRKILQKKLPVPKIIEGKNKISLFEYKNKNLTIEQFVKGKSTNRLNEKMVISSAKTLALMNKALLKLKFNGFTGESMFKPHEWGVKRIDDFNFEGEENRLLKESKKINRRKLRKSIIHSDFHPDANLLFRKKKIVAILDWSDMQRTFLIYDVAIFTAHAFVKRNKIEKEKIKLFFKTYQKYLKLNDGEKKAIYYLMKRRILGALLWCYLQAKQHKDRKRKLNRWARYMIKCYKTLDKFPLEDFLKLF